MIKCSLVIMFSIPETEKAPVSAKEPTTPAP